MSIMNDYLDESNCLWVGYVSYFLVLLNFSTLAVSIYIKMVMVFQPEDLENIDTKKMYQKASSFLSSDMLCDVSIFHIEVISVVCFCTVTVFVRTESLILLSMKFTVMYKNRLLIC
jgi:hypothetical protein